MSTHIAEDAPGLASLPKDDPERIAAYEHAATCPPCRAALRESERLVLLIDQAPKPPPPSEAAMRRAWNLLTVDMDAAEREAAAIAARRPGARFWPAAAVAFSALLVFLDARGGALAWTVGVECLFIELGTAAAGVGIAAFIVRNRAGHGRAPAFAALAAWSAAAAQVYLHFRCPAAHALPHLVAFHFVGVVLAALLGGPLGSRWSHTAA